MVVVVSMEIIVDSMAVPMERAYYWNSSITFWKMLGSEGEILGIAGFVGTFHSGLRSRDEGNARVCWTFCGEINGGSWCNNWEY